MKFRLSLLIALLGCGFSGASAQPAPRKTSPHPGSFVFQPGTTIAADETLQPLARYAAEYLGYPVRTGVTGDGAIVLTLDADSVAGNSPAAEAYSLDIATDHIRINASTSGGVFNGLQQLFRLLPPEVYNRQGVPVGTMVSCTRIEDTPRYAYRGVMIDVARTWIDASRMKRYIDLLSYHNINKLHIHLTDDEGWRIEIKSHPELAQIGGFRGGDSPVRSVYGKWGEKYGGYYTQDEMRELIDYAALRNIEIIPEIDLPGHSRTIASIHPEIRCNYPPDTVSTNGYDYRNAWCVAREENYALLEDILGELCELFPSKCIHVGGDEVDMTQWKRCPDCQALMRQRGMTDPHQLEDLFMKRMASILATHGKYPGVWNEAVRTGDLSRESLVYGWENTKACLDATAKGYNTIVMPGEYFYFDMRQSEHEDGHSWAAIFDAGKTYRFDLDNAGFSAEQQQRIVGMEGAFWSEIHLSHNPEQPDYLDYMLFPRVCALARIAWSGNAEGWESYYKELKEKHYARMAAMGIRFRLFPPQVTYADGKLSASVDDGSELLYCADNDATEHPYTQPIATTEPYRYRFISRLGTARSPHAADPSYWKTVKPAVKITSSMPENPRFPLSNAENYRGMSRTKRTCGQQDWILYTFAEPVACREITIQTGYPQLPLSIITTGYAEISYNGNSFHKAGELQAGRIRLHPEKPVKAVRIVSTCDDNGTPFVTILAPEVKPRL